MHDRRTAGSRTFPRTGEHIDAADYEGITALLHAAIYDDRELLRNLISSAVEVNQRTPDGQTAISMVESCSPIKNRKNVLLRYLNRQKAFDSAEW